MIPYVICFFLPSLSMIISSCIHVAANGIISFFFYGWVVFCCICLPRILYPFISDNAFKGVLSYFPRPHQSVGLSEGTCYSNPLNVIVSCPYSSTASTQLFLMFPWYPMWTHESFHWPSHEHICDHHQGPHGAPALSSPSRLWDKGLACGRCLAGDAEEAIWMLILPDYFCTWASGTCSISAWLPFPFQPFLQKWKWK